MSTNPYRKIAKPIGMGAKERASLRDRSNPHVKHQDTTIM